MAFYVCPQESSGPSGLGLALNPWGDGLVCLSPGEFRTFSYKAPHEASALFLSPPPSFPGVGRRSRRRLEEGAPALASSSNEALPLSRKAVSGETAPGGGGAGEGSPLPPRRPSEEAPALASFSSRATDEARPLSRAFLSRESGGGAGEGSPLPPRRPSGLGSSVESTGKSSPRRALLWHKHDAFEADFPSPLNSSFEEIQAFEVPPPAPAGTLSPLFLSLPPCAGGWRLASSMLRRAHQREGGKGRERGGELPGREAQRLPPPPPPPPPRPTWS